jgi:NAD(P)-dependent dehydrogenase (short-subunit alcohol dehydrogenase family)
LSGRRALVTGASRGIGLAIAEELAAAGHRVAASARSEAALAEAAGPRGDAGGEIVALAADMADPADCAALADRAAEALGGSVEILVYCAGISRTGRVAELAVKDWNESLQVNVTGALQVSAGVIPAMSAAGWGRIINILSLYSRFGVPTSAPYTVSKHALLGLTRVQSAELIRDGITVNGVVPGWVDTEMVQAEAQAVATAKDLPVDEVRKRFLRGQPLGRMIEPAEVATLVGFLCGDSAGAITGQALGIDGGSYQA